MVNRYCSNHGECASQPEVRQTIKKIEALLGSSCKVSYEVDEDLMVVALKAIGNVGRIVKSENSLERCWRVSPKTIQ